MFKTKMSRFVMLTLAALMLSLVGTGALAQEPASPADLCGAATPAETPENRQFEAAEQVIEEGVDYRAIFCTDAGPIYIDLYEGLTPITVNNFVFLAQQGYYNNTIFHRVIEGFMAQGGDPTGTGMGSPGYQFEDEFVNYLVFDTPGLLAMANGGPGTNGSQFFITTVPTPHLDFGHTIFGEVLEGQENVEAIQLRDPEQADAPATTIETILIVTADEVTSTFEEMTLTGDDALLAFDELQEGLELPGFTLSGGDDLLDSSAVANTAPEGLVADYETLLTENNHEFRITHSINNDACDVETYPFAAMQYNFDSFATAEEAAAVIDSDLYASLAEADGFTADESGEFYTKTVSACDDTIEATQIRYIKRDGRYIQTVETIVPNDERFTPQQITEFVVLRLYEQVMRDFLRNQIRSN